MLDRLHQLPEGIDGLRARGKVTKEDYDRVFHPLVDEARREGRKIRLVYELGPEFDGFSAGAAWEDARIGLQNVRRFERCAVVSDYDWVRDGARILGALWPCPVKTFACDEFQQAVDWLSTPGASSTLSHRLLPEEGVVVVELDEPLQPDDFEGLAITVDPWIEAHGVLRGLVLHGEKLPGWRNVAGALSHLRFVKDHQAKIARVALVAGGTLAEIGPKLAEHFVEAEVRHFAADELDAAIEWAADYTRAESRSDAEAPTPPAE